MKFAKQMQWGWMVLLGIIGLTAMAGGPQDFRPGQSQSLTFEDRVWAQTQIERVYYNHRIWPKENPEPKPPFEQMVTRAQIEAKVTDALMKSAALDQFWQRPITGEQLQAEMERMAKGSRDGATLRELFAALHNDPRLIAETLARETLADRLIRNWYANDTRFHVEARSKADAVANALAPLAVGGSRLRELKRSAEQLGERREAFDSWADRWREAPGEGTWKSQGGEYHHQLILLDDHSERPESHPKNPDERRVDAEEFDTLKKRYLRDFASPLRSEESPEHFALTRIVSQTETQLELETLTFSKQPFEEWFMEQFTEQRFVPPLMEATFLAGLSLPSIPESAGEGGWNNGSLDDIPDQRGSHTAIWTGSEMIVWGGYYYNGGDFYLNSGGRYNPATDAWLATSTGANVPAARRSHTAFWTGSEMIVWGGDDGLYLNSGGRYNPSTDAWRATSIGANVPVVRSEYSAIWTGSEMIVWGGNNGFYLITGGRYNPSTDAWLATSMGANVPDARSRHTPVWAGSEMIVWGGRNNVSPYNLNTGGRYNPSTNSWLATSMGANVPAVRESHTAFWTGSEMIVWGGGGGVFGLNTGGRYNPATDTWLATSMGANVPAARSSHNAVWTGSEMIVWGGWNGSYLNTGGRYNPSTDSWLATSIGANVPAARISHTAIWTGSEMIVWGGNYYSGGDYYLNTGGRYNPSTDAWLATSMSANVPAARRDHTAIWTGSEMIVWGGQNYTTQTNNLNSGGRYNPATDSWLATSMGANVPAARRSHTAVWTGSEMIVWGGVIYDCPGICSYIYYNTGGRYNPTTGSWLATSIGANVPAARASHTAIWTGSEMIVWGGNNGAYLNTGGRYNPSTDLWLATSIGANIPVARTSHTAVWTGSVMIVWGGNNGVSPYLNSGGRYNPATDAWLPTIIISANDPAGRHTHSAVWTGSEMIVWGGAGSPILNNGGRYNPSTNSWLATSLGANVPAARLNHTAVWTGSEMIVWGGNGGSYLNSGGRYNPATDAWFATSMGANVPAARASHTAVWTGSEMMVWGGWAGSFSLLNGGRYNPSCEAPVMSVNRSSKVSLDVVQTWTTVVGATSYNVYRNPSNNPATWGAALATGITGMTWSDTGQLSNTTSQFYSVTDVNTCGAESDK